MWKMRSVPENLQDVILVSITSGQKYNIGNNLLTYSAPAYQLGTVANMKMVEIWVTHTLTCCTVREYSMKL